MFGTKAPLGHLTSDLWEGSLRPPVLVEHGGGDGQVEDLQLGPDDEVVEEACPRARRQQLHLQVGVQPRRHLRRHSVT